MKDKSNYVRVDKLTSIIGGQITKEYYIKDGGVISASTAPGCWGPMITPELYSGHEVTAPVYLEGAMPGDTVAIYIKKIEILSEAATSGTGKTYPERFDGDPSVYAKCPHCNIHNPKTYIEGIGEEAIRCENCGNPIIPQIFENGYTVVYSKEDNLAVAVNKEIAEEIARNTARNKLYKPENSKQHLATILGRADFSDLLVRSYPMIGNIGCSPASAIPASKNAGDYVHTVKKTPLFKQPSLNEINDAHMDISHIGEGCIILSPVLVEGAGIYFGDVHLIQGCGELAGHTLDVSAEVEITVHLLKNVSLEGPVIIPVKSELNPRFQPFSDQEYEIGQKILREYGAELKEKSYPIQVIGSGVSLNEAIDVAVHRASRLTGLSIGEIKNRGTAGGEVGIGRVSGFVYLTLMLSESVLEKIGLLELAKTQYEA